MEDDLPSPRPDSSNSQEPTYQEIRAELDASPKASDAALLERSKKDDPGVASEHPIELPSLSKTVRKWKPRARKDITCAKCGKVFSSNTRQHKCISQTHIASRGTDDALGDTIAPPPLPKLLDRQRAITIDEVRDFLRQDRERHRTGKRERWLGSLF